MRCNTEGCDRTTHHRDNDNYTATIENTALQEQQIQQQDTTTYTQWTQQQE